MISDLLTHFFSYREPDHEEWDSAVAEFKDRIPELAQSAKKLIDAEHKTTNNDTVADRAKHALMAVAIEREWKQASPVKR